MRYWLIQLPLMVPTESREELAMTAHNLSNADYTDVIWACRVSEKPPKKRARSKSWPASIFDKALKGYILATDKPSNVTPIRKKKP